MTLAEALSGELQYEAQSLRKTLERVPFDKLDYRPHPKSMTMGQLASHLAEIFGWTRETITLDHFQMDPATFVPFNATSQEQLLAKFDEGLKAAVETLDGISDNHMRQSWKMSSGGKVFIEAPRIVVMRGFVLKHAVHHRAQLGLYLRLNDIPVPSVYGPSADEAA